MGTTRLKAKSPSVPECGNAQITATRLQEAAPGADVMQSGQAESTMDPFAGGAAQPLQPQPQSQPTKTSATAIWSMVLGILSVALCLNALTAIPGLILGIVSLNKIGASQQMLTGKGMAIAGIVLSSVGLLMVPILVSMTFPAYNKIQERAKIAKDIANVRQIVLACRTYAADNDGVFPGYSEDGEMLKTSTEVFNILLSEGYLDSESLFWTPGNPDKPTPPNEDGILTKEENCYAYVVGQSDSTFSRSPLVADEMESPGIYGEKHPWLKSRNVVVGYCGGQVMNEKLGTDQPGAVAITRDGMEVFEERQVDGGGGSSSGLLAVPVEQVLLP